jgi:outer membrane protein
MKACLLALMIGAGFLVTGSAGAADLLEVYRKALTHDAQYLAARATLDAGREKLPQGKSALMPNVSMTANTTYNDIDFTGVNRSYRSSGYTVTLAQPLFRWQNWVGYNQAQLQVAQAESTFAQAGQDLALRVAQAYFDVLTAEAGLEAIKAQKLAISRQLDLAKKTFEVGTSTITDTHEAQSRFDLVTAQQLAAENELDVRREALRIVAGEVPASVAKLNAGAKLAAPVPANIDSWVAAAEADAPAVAVQRITEELAVKEIERQRAGHYPTLDLVATHGDNRANNGAFGVASDTRSNTIGLQLTVPLFSGGLTSSREREAAANREAARAGVTGAQRGAALGARQAYLGVVSGLSQIKALEAALISSESALASTKLGYEVGVRINIDVLNAEQQVAATKRDLAKARHDTLLAQLRLKAAVGRLDDAAISEVSALLAN